MTSQDGTHYFANASNATFVNPRITHVNGDAYLGSQERKGFKLLLENISKGAFHDAAERGDPPKCHPRTRTAIHSELMEWIKAPEAKRKLVIWMYGPAGSGKTAIAQSIAEECKALGLLAASFFFFRTASERNNATRFIATIAYQISRFLPEFEDHVLNAIEWEPTIFSRKLSTQIKKLIIEPLRLLPSASVKPIFVVVDGLDECGPDSQSPSEVLEVLGTAISNLQHFPLLFLIGSRPDYEIRQIFSSDMLGAFTHSIVLDDTYKPDEDIRIYLISKFQEIQDKQRSAGSPLSASWPAEADIDHLVYKASGQFIFAATVVKFVDSSRYNPAQRLDIILGLSTSGDENPFALLDELYRYILTSVTDLPKVLEILNLLVLGRNYSEDVIGLGDLKLGVRFIAGLLEIDVRRTLLDMHALIFMPPPSDNDSALHIHHASLYDFLTDKSRSHDLYIDSDEGHAALIGSWLKMAAKQHTIEYPTLAGVLRVIVYHCNRTKNDVSDSFALFDLKNTLEKITDLDNLHHPLWNYFFNGARRKGNNRVDVFPRLLNEFDTFVVSRLAQYPPLLQTCIPTIYELDASDFSVSTIFRFMLAATVGSQAEFDDVRKLDARLLDLYNHSQRSSSISSLLGDRERAGRFYAGDRSGYTVVGKLAVKVIYTKNKFEYDYDLSLTEPASPNSEKSTFQEWVRKSKYGWFTKLLSEAPIDIELATLLRDRALQLRENTGSISYWKLVAKASLKYVRRCEIPHLKHTHASDFIRCMICDSEECMTASVVSPDQSDAVAQDISTFRRTLSVEGPSKSATSILLSPENVSSPPSGAYKRDKKNRGLLKRILHL